jgi:ribosomal protein L34
VGGGSASEEGFECWWPWDLWRVSTRALRSERCWERAKRFGFLERMASDSVSSSSRALMATGRRR